MNRYLDCAKRQAELESETKGLEQDIKAAQEQIQDDAGRLVAAEQQARRVCDELDGKAGKMGGRWWTRWRGRVTTPFDVCHLTRGFGRRGRGG